MVAQWFTDTRGVLQKLIITYNTQEISSSGWYNDTIKNSSVTTKHLYLVLTFRSHRKIFIRRSWYSVYAYDRFLDATADRRIKTRKNWVPAFLMKISWWNRNVKIRYKCLVVTNEFLTVTYNIDFEKILRNLNHYLSVHKYLKTALYLAACWTTDSGKSEHSRQINEWYSYISMSSEMNSDAQIVMLFKQHITNIIWKYNRSDKYRYIHCFNTKLNHSNWIISIIFSILTTLCKYDLVVYDNLYIINKHFSKKIEILYSEMPMNINTTKCSNIYDNN